MVPENPMLSDRVDAVRPAGMSSTFRAWLRLQGARQTRKNTAGRGSSLKEETPMTGNERLSNHHRLPTPSQRPAHSPKEVLPLSHIVHGTAVTSNSPGAAMTAA